MKLTSYRQFGNDGKYKEYEFTTFNEDKITICTFPNRITIECEEVNIEDVEEAIKQVRSGLITVGVK